MVSPNSRRLLLVDDEPAIRDLLREIVSEEGYAVEAAETGAEALRKSAATAFEVFLVDLHLPDMTGLELIDRLQLKGRACEAIVVTGERQHALVQRAMEQGVFSYILKPFHSEEIRKKVAEAFRLAAWKRERIEHLGALEQGYFEKNRALETAMEALKNEKLRLSAVLDSLDEGLLALDAAGLVMLMNRPAEQLLGPRLAEVLGEPVTAVARDTRLLSFLGDGKSGLPAPFTLRDAEGEVRQYAVRRAPVKSARGEASGEIITFSDETGKVAMEQLRAFILSIVAHELRTPLSVFSNYLAVLSKTPSKEIMEEVIAGLQSAKAGMMDIVEEIVHIARVSDAYAAIAPSRFSPSEIVRETVTAARTRAEEKGVRIEVETGSAPAEWSTDAKLLGIALRSLVKNAVKLTRDRGRVRVEAVPGGEGQRGPTVVFRVTDEGQGLDEETRTLFLKPFLQGDRVWQHQGSGVGAGLFIVRRAADLLRGKIDVQSPPGGGALFTLSLPQISPLNAEGVSHAHA